MTTMFNRLAETIGTAYADHRIAPRLPDHVTGVRYFVERRYMPKFFWENVAGPFSARAAAAAELNRIVARAALAELRGMSGEMQAAGRDKFGEWLRGGRLAKPAEHQWQPANEVFLAMIDEAGK